MSDTLICEDCGREFGDPEEPIYRPFCIDCSDYVQDLKRRISERAKAKIPENGEVWRLGLNLRKVLGYEDGIVYFTNGDTRSRRSCTLEEWTSWRRNAHEEAKC